MGRVSGILVCWLASVPFLAAPGGTQDPPFPDGALEGRLEIECRKLSFAARLYLENTTERDIGFVVGAGGRKELVPTFHWGDIAIIPPQYHRPQRRGMRRMTFTCSGKMEVLYGEYILGYPPFSRLRKPEITARLIIKEHDAVIHTSPQPLPIPPSWRSHLERLNCELWYEPEWKRALLEARADPAIAGFIGYRKAAQKLCKRFNWFPDGCLRRKFEAQDRLVIHVVGELKKYDLLPELKACAMQDEGPRGQDSRRVLCTWRTPAATEALNDVLRDAAPRIKWQVCRELVQCGNLRTLELLEDMSRDERYDKTHQDRFASAARTLRLRLKVAE